MKFWAILKDSLREAVDCKVMYVMVGLSCLVILVVGSMTFKPMSARTTMENLLSGEFLFTAKVLQGEPVETRKARPPKRPAAEGLYRVRGVRALHGAGESPESEYVFIITQNHATAAEAQLTRQAPELALENLKNLFMFAEQWQLLHFAEIRVLNERPDWIKEPGLSDQLVYFEIRTEPTDSTLRLWSHEPALFFGLVPLRESFPLGMVLFGVASIVLSLGSWVTILVSVIITAFFIPNMLRKGTVDLLLAKPIARWSLLGYKYLGGLFFIFLNTSFAIVGIWLVLGLRSGLWANSFLLMILVITFFFAILYAVSTLFAVLTQSAVVAILMTCGAWFLFFIVGTLFQFVEVQDKKELAEGVPEEERITQNFFGRTVYAVHMVTPRTSDLNYLANKFLLSDFLTGDLTMAANLDKTSTSWGESITVSLVFVALMLGLACWRFAVKDY